jgi:hypothetical protein
LADALTTAVASALVGKGAEVALEGGRSACVRLLKVVRRRFARDKDAMEVLDAAQRGSVDPSTIAELAKLLEHFMAEDAAFALQVRTLWSQASMELSASGDGVINTATGTVSGNLVQARDVHIEGDLRLG